jgi:hypothetical protein
MAVGVDGWRARRLFQGAALLLAFLLQAAPVLAQGEQAAPPRCTGEGRATLGADEVIARTIGFQGEGPARPRMFALVRDREARLSGNSVHLLLQPGERDAVEWSKVRLIGAARTAEHVALPQGRGFAEDGIFARLISHAGGVARVELDLPQRPGARRAEHWHAVVAVCSTADDALMAFGTVEVRVHSWASSAMLSGGLLIAIYAGLVAVALRINAARLDRVAATRFVDEPVPLGWRLRQALNPVFITQDASGVGSLARLQLLVFTLAVVFVYSYVLARTGELAALSSDVLALLGITVLGSGLSRLVGESGSVSAANRGWLKARGLLKTREDRTATLADLVCADGELEIARVQAIVFSSITVVALLLNGPRDLGGFEISNETLYLLGLSQAAYVAGKAIPAEGVRRLNAEVAALRAAERALAEAQSRSAAASAMPAPATAEEALLRSAERVRSDEGMASARGTWNGALAAAEDTLADVYGERLDTAALHALRAA